MKTNRRSMLKFLASFSALGFLGIKADEPVATVPAGYTRLTPLLSNAPSFYLVTDFHGKEAIIPRLSVYDKHIRWITEVSHQVLAITDNNLVTVLKCRKVTSDIVYPYMLNTGINLHQTPVAIPYYGYADGEIVCFKADNGFYIHHPSYKIFTTA